MCRSFLLSQAVIKNFCIYICTADSVILYLHVQTANSILLNFECVLIAENFVNFIELYLCPYS